jgi:hypothetical protein
VNIHQRAIVLPPGGKVTIYQDSDTHLRSDGHDAMLHREFVKTVAQDRGGYWVHTGDMIDDDRPSTRDRRRMMYMDRIEALKQEDKDHMLQMERVVLPRYDSIREKCLGVIDGDHYRIYSTGLTSGQFVARELKVPYLGERMGYVVLTFRQANRNENTFRYVILARHGRGSAATVGGDANSLVKQNVRFDGDCFFGGHTHGKNVHDEQHIGVNRGGTGFYMRTRWYVRGGSFLRGYIKNQQLYPEREEYPPLSLGWGQVELWLRPSAQFNGNLGVVRSKGSLVTA